MTAPSNKTTLREAFSIQARSFRLIHQYCPGCFLASALHATVSALGPYVTVWFSAQIINELAGLRRAEVLWPLVLLTLSTGAFITFLTGALLRWKQAKTDQYEASGQRIFTDKMLSMDFPDVDNIQTHDKLAQIRENEQFNGWGFGMSFWIFSNLMQGSIGVLGALALTVTLFTLPVPETAGRLTVLNHPVFLLFLLAVLGLATWLGPICKNKAEQFWITANEEGKFANRLFEAFALLAEEASRAPDIRMYNQQVIARHYMSQQSIFNADGTIARCAKGSMGFWSALGSCIGAVLTGMVYVFVCLKAWAGAFGVGSVTQYVGAVTALAGNISKLIEAIGTMKNNVPFMRKIYEFLDMPNRMYQGSLTTEKRSDRQYEVEFKDVSFRYPGTDTWALNHVNIKFKVGSRLAVVGENGSGKTTFIKLLCRLYDPQEGQILLNGIDIRKYNYRDYMNIFAVVFQDFQLISQPLGATVAGSQNYDADRVRKALEDAGFGERLGKMPQGLNTVLYKEFAKDGVEVSGGEAQKIAIARALYRDAPFIILDEPTAALDPVAEAEIYSKFNEISGDRTAIYISHRLSSCKFCDEIAVFDQGKVIQQGTHDALLSDTNGKYYALWNAQAQYYTE